MAGDRPDRSDFERRLSALVWEATDDPAKMAAFQRLAPWLGAAPAAPRRAAPAGAPPRRRRRVTVPAGLRRGLALLTRLRGEAAAGVLRRDARAAAEEGTPLAPATALRKRRDGTGYGLTGRYRGAGAILHGPAWILPQLDDACRQALARHWQGKAVEAPVPELTPGEAVAIGLCWALVCATNDGERPPAIPPVADLGRLAGLVRALRKHPGWAERLRRCDYAREAGTGCYRYFFDKSAARNARGCRPAHTVRIIEEQGAVRPRRGPAARPRKP